MVMRGNTTPKSNSDLCVDLGTEYEKIDGQKRAVRISAYAFDSLTVNRWVSNPNTREPES